MLDKIAEIRHCQILTGLELTVRTSHLAKRFCKIEKICEAEI